jgi:hypothetical protein
MAQAQEHAFPYDPALMRAVQTAPGSIADVLQALHTIDATCVDGDGLKWFNWLYTQVTQAIQSQIAAGGLNNPAWVTALDIQFATRYFSALEVGLQERPVPGCWTALLSQRANTRVARIQFALAGTNSHINHDLPEAIVTNCHATGAVPQHGSPQYNDYTALNATLDPLIGNAMEVLHVRLLGDPLPPISHLEDTMAAWSLSAARETAWNNAEILWHLQDAPVLASAFTDSLDALTTVASEALLVAAP